MIWEKPYGQPQLLENEVHLWSLHTVAHRDKKQELWKVLSEDELARAAKFRFEKDRFTYVLARAMLRNLLGMYLQMPAGTVSFRYNEQSKPSVSASNQLQFNISHSHERIIMGFVLQHDIGVDVEFNKKPVEVRQIVSSFFSKLEIDTLLALPEQQHLEAFYNCWTRKEAFIKAKGGGLSIPLDQFQVTFTPGDQAALIAINWDMADVPHWQMKAFLSGEDYTGASIVHGPVSNYRFFDGNQLVLE